MKKSNKFLGFAMKCECGYVAVKTIVEKKDGKLYQVYFCHGCKNSFRILIPLQKTT